MEARSGIARIEIVLEFKELCLIRRLHWLACQNLFGLNFSEGNLFFNFAEIASWYACLFMIKSRYFHFWMLFEVKIFWGDNFLLVVKSKAFWFPKEYQCLSWYYGKFSLYRVIESMLLFFLVFYLVLPHVHRKKVFPNPVYNLMILLKHCYKS